MPAANIYHRRKYTRKRRFVPKRTSRRSRTAYRKKTWRRSMRRKSWPSASLLPRTKFLSFVYADTDFALTVNAAGSHQATYTFRGNSCYDPDYTATGVQPYGWDNWAGAQYQKYMVYASKIKLYITTNIATTTCPALKCFVVPYRDTVLSSTDPADLMNYPLARQILVGTNTKTGTYVKLKHYTSTKRALGWGSYNFGDGSAAYNSNPAVVWYWQILFDNTSWGGGTDVNVHFDVKIKYYTKLYNPVELNES